MIIDEQPGLNGDSTSKRTRAALKELIHSLRDGDRSARVSRAQRKARYATLLSETGDPQRAKLGLEQLISGNDLVGIGLSGWRQPAPRAGGR